MITKKLKLKKINKIMLFTHTDLDGIGCSIVAKHFFSPFEVTTEYCNYNDIENKVQNFIINGDYLYYDFVFITDIHINHTNLELINLIENKIPHKLFLFDHHVTALDLNVYDWAYVYHDEKNKKSGTKIFYEFLKENIEKENETLEEFVTLVSNYDTWLWKDLNDEKPRLLNDLFGFYGRTIFEENMLKNNLKKKKFNFSTNDRMMLKILNEKRESYLNKKLKENIQINFEGYLANVVFTIEQDIFYNDCASFLNENTNADFTILISPPNKVSLRTIKDIDLTTIAKKYNGGGHQKAAGFNLRNCKELLDLYKNAL